MPSRSEIRREIRSRRNALDIRQRRSLSRSLARRVATSPIFRRSLHIAFYLANDGEVDLGPLMERAFGMGKRCYLPVLSPTFHNRLWFAPYGPDTPLAPNQFGILEPVVNWRNMRPSWSLDLVLTPLVAFDNQGNRLGMGGGFYDRTLAYLERRRLWCKPRLIGTAYGFQQVPALSHAPWDVPLHGVMTENAFHRFAPQMAGETPAVAEPISAPAPGPGDRS